MIQVRGLVVAYGGVRAVDGLDLAIAPGSATALVGSNGAGKSTTLRVLAGVLPPSDGRVVVADIDVVTDPMEARRRTGYCPDVGGLVPRATAWEHLELAARLRGSPRWEPRARDLLRAFDLEGAADRVVAGYSHGMSRRLSVLLAVVHEPPVLLLDEPFDGVDPLGVEATLGAVARAREDGATVLLSTHLLALAVEACSEAVVLRRGRVVSAAPTRELTGPDGGTRYRDLLAGA